MFQFESIEVLSVLFFLTALLYALVGFGGGSTYIALLSIASISHKVGPTIALICNITVVAGGFYHFSRNKQVSIPLVFPFLLLSIPLAYLGGRIPIDKELYQLILGVALLTSAIKMIFFNKSQLEGKQNTSTPPFFCAVAIGGIIGFISGLVGIGGGVFLAPTLYLARWGAPRQIAATSSIFILVNSISGLLGQIQKTGGVKYIEEYLFLIVSVFLGGQIGSWLCNNQVSHRKIEILTSILLMFVSTKLLANFLW